MNLITTWIKNIRLRQIVAMFLATATLLIGTAFSTNAQHQAQAAKLLTPENNTEKVSPETVKTIQQNAEDFPSEKIGDTGLKNIRNLGNNIPKVIKQNVDETLNPDNPEAPGTRMPTRYDRD